MFHVYTNGKTLEIPAHKMRVDSHGNLVLSDAQNKNLLIITNNCWDGCEFKKDEEKTLLVSTEGSFEK